MKTKAYIIFSVVLLAGCYDDFTMPHVVSAAPGKNELSVSRDISAVVAFSKTMDTMKTSNEFTLSSSSGAVEGFFSWGNSDTVMSFHPAEPLKRTEKYTIRITGDAEDTEGNDLSDEFISSFYTGGDDVRPEVDSFNPAANSIGNSDDTLVTVIFSEPMDPDTVYDGLTVSPATEGYYEWNSDYTAVVFRPLYGLNYGVTYNATVSTAMKDSAGNSLLEEVSFSFTIGDDFTPPQLTVYQDNSTPLYLDENVQTPGAEKNGSIVIDFSEIVLTDGIADAVGISPAAEFYVTTSTVESGGVNITRAVVNFTENLESEEIYTLRIGSFITDLQQNNLAREYRFVFVTDGPYSLRPFVSKIGDIVTIDSSAWPINDIVILSLAEDFNGNASKLYNNIAIDFSNSIDPLSLDIAVDIVAGDTGSPSVVNIGWPSNPPDARFTRLTFGLYGVSPGKTYSLRLKGGSGGIKDQYGNYMKEDFVQIIKFNQL
ncbi:MAG TPA: Ig-like domain-containing protein [Spirochaetota bacterium]|nr:Ig-like domain-containing protein [Spirochaetota bacterium]